MAGPGGPRRQGRGRPRPAGAAPARARVDPARRAAFDVLRAVRVDDAYTNLVLPAVLREHRLSGRDAAFVTELASGTLRRLGTYDAVLAACVDRGLAKVEAKVLDALRLGTHQLLAMRVPAHAAISTTVDLVRDRAGQGAAGFANAVLRRVAAHDLDAWVRRVAPDPAADPDGWAAVAHGHPAWVVGALREALAATGAADELEALLAADNAPAGVTLVARPGRVDVDVLAEAVAGERTVLSPHGVRLPGGDPGAVAAVATGAAGVQDEGSQLVAVALARADPAPAEPAGGASGERWLDTCAGPGGKAALLAALAAGRGARLTAAEKQEHRTGLVRRALEGADGVEAVLTADGTAPPWAPGSFDRVLVDVPCSGLGALRRRPESRWRRRPDDVTALRPLQEALLAAALDSVRPGGVVLYATCSPVLAETTGVVAAVLAGRPDVRLEDTAALLPEVTDGRGPEVAGADGPGASTVQLWPHRHGTDAMFLAALRRMG